MSEREREAIFHALKEHAGVELSEHQIDNVLDHLARTPSPEREGECIRCGAPQNAATEDEGCRQAGYQEPHDFSLRTPPAPDGDVERIIEVFRAPTDSDDRGVLDSPPWRERAANTLARLRSEPPAPEPGWRPIETAPKDGTVFLAAMSNDHANTGLGRITFCAWDDGWFDAATGDYGSWFNPTHWMPLPPAPTDTGEAG